MYSLDDIAGSSKSYVLKSLNFIDKKLRLDERFPDSKIAKGFDTSKDFILHGYIGMLPGDMQEGIAKTMEQDPLMYTKKSFGVEAIIIGAKIAPTLVTPDIITTGLLAWAGYSVVETAVRGIYIKTTDKPIGALLFSELPYKLGIFTKNKMGAVYNKVNGKSLNSSDE